MRRSKQGHGYRVRFQYLMQRQEAKQTGVDFLLCDPSLAKIFLTDRLPEHTSSITSKDGTSHPTNGNLHI